MTKKKVFELSIINKTHTESALDITHFYTSDTALELVFRLIEKEYTFDSVEVLLLNVDDKSIVTRKTTKSDNWYSYELDDDIVAHYGQWKGQLQLKKGSETYVSSPFNFRIENDLQNDRQPQLTEVNNWKNLRTIADGLIDDLRIELESLTEQELEIENAETARQQAESQRQYTFETNETERQTTFETAESERQSAELIRVENEVTRQENESVRQQALGDMNGLYERIYPVSKNLFNHNKLTFSGRLDRNTGRIINSDKDCYTDFISVKENTPYTISKQGEPYSVVSYDSDYNYIKGYLLGGTFGDTTINTPMNTSFLRYSFNLSNIKYEQIMLNEGNEILPFEEYQEQGSHDKTVAGVFNYLLDSYFNL